MATNATTPPAKVPVLAVSPLVGQTRNGARSPSDLDRCASSAEDSPLLPGT